MGRAFFGTPSARGAARAASSSTPLDAPSSRRARPLLGRFGRLAPWVVVPTALAASIAACGNSTKPPGFEELGGAGGTGADVASSSESSSSKSSSHASSSVASTTVSTTVSSAVSTGSGPACDDTGPGEPNNDEQHATNLGNIDDCDSSGDSASGVLKGPTDVDWYRYHGADTFGCTVDPTRSLQSSDPVRLCKFAQCDNAEVPMFSCPSGSTSATSPEGRPGCCAFGDFSIGLTCGSSSLNSDDGTIFVRIDNPQANPCPSYTFSYHY